MANKIAWNISAHGRAERHLFRSESHMKSFCQITLFDMFGAYWVTKKTMSPQAVPLQDI